MSLPRRIPRSARWLAGSLTLLYLACSQPEPAAVPPAPVPEVPTPEAPPPRPAPPAAEPGVPAVVAPLPGEPRVRVALGTGRATVTVGGGDALVLTDPAGGLVAEAPAGATLALVPVPGGAGVSDGATADSLLIRAQSPGGFVRVEGQEYRGDLLVLRDPAGLTVVNRVALESYLAGVVSSEMGRRAPEEEEALKAQAVVSRTFAVRNRGKWRALGFDFYNTVVDQVYGGVAAETQESWLAVTGTAGQILTWDGAPIDAFFFSTCGGRTADGTEVFAGADRPYLRSVADTDPAGEAYCRISPRYHWRVEWSGEQLRQMLRRTLPPVTGRALPPGSIVRSVRITDRTASYRVARLALDLGTTSVSVQGPAIRRVLRDTGGDPLRSASFTLEQTRAGGRVVRLVADGHGAGHGVGFCQWGAVGRARAGFGYRDILQAYFPHTDLQRLY